MTRQHFEALADLSADLIADLEPDRTAAEGIVKRVADLCAGSNGRFDRGRFERVTFERAARRGWDPLASAPPSIREACHYAALEVIL
jgi:hypothetical protein